MAVVGTAASGKNQDGNGDGDLECEGLLTPNRDEIATAKRSPRSKNKS